LNNNLDVATIEAILLAKQNATEKQNRDNVELLYTKIGLPIAVPSEADLEFSDKIKTFVIHSIATKLVVNDHSVPLISLEEIEPIISEFLDKKIEEDTRKKLLDQYDRLFDYNGSQGFNLEVKSIEGAEAYVERMSVFEETKPSAEERAAIEMMMKSVASSVIKLVDSSADAEDPYDYYWKFLNTTQVLANDQMIPLDQPLTPELYDEVTRRMFTREQYIERNKKALKIFDDPENIINSIIAPLLTQLGIDDDMSKEERDEMEAEIRKSVMAEVTPMFDIIEKFTAELAELEADRIYPK